MSQFPPDRPNASHQETIIPLEALPARRRRPRALHTVGLVAASITGAVQFAGAEATAGASLMTYGWGDITMAAQRSANHSGTTAPQRVVFIHGTPGSAGAWEDYLADVPEGFEFIAVDRAGFGDSGPDNAVTSLEDHARAIAPLLDARGTIVVGHSLGGPVAAMLGILKPDAVQALVIVAGSLDPALEEIHFMQPVGEWWGVRHVLPRMIRNANRELLALEPELQALSARLEELTMPVEIIHGTEDNLTPFANVAYMRATMVNAPLNITVLEGENHFLPWNAKQHIDAAIRRVAAPGNAP
ncbi:alpha/beta fold hydrolase [Pyruvatibacter mobilis]|uniref:alpha/beta fold hydrolase n=1 Tax=Pyruvatibacter mobilis TaxID=1712261 RepID=UPI003D0E283A